MSDNPERPLPKKRPPKPPSCPPPKKLLGPRQPETPPPEKLLENVIIPPVPVMRAPNIFRDKPVDLLNPRPPLKAPSSKSKDTDANTNAVTKKQVATYDPYMVFEEPTQEETPEPKQHRELKPQPPMSMAHVMQLSAKSSGPPPPLEPTKMLRPRGSSTLEPTMPTPVPTTVPTMPTSQPTMPTSQPSSGPVMSTPQPMFQESAPAMPTSQPTCGPLPSSLPPVPPLPMPPNLLQFPDWRPGVQERVGPLMRADIPESAIIEMFADVLQARRQALRGALFQPAERPFVSQLHPSTGGVNPEPLDPSTGPGEYFE